MSGIRVVVPRGDEMSLGDIGDNTKLYYFMRRDDFPLADGDSAFFFSMGPTQIDGMQGPITLLATWEYAVLSGPRRFYIDSPGGVVVFVVSGYKAIDIRRAGPLEAEGRVKGLWGASYSHLIPPSSKGDPGLVHVNLINDLRSRADGHLSVRAGVVIRGRGRLSHSSEGQLLSPGAIFIIPEGTSYQLGLQSESMDLVVFRPFSDWGFESPPQEPVEGLPSGNPVTDQVVAELGGKTPEELARIEGEVNL